MSIHARTQIRNAVTNLLIDNTLVGSNVFESRIQPISNAKLPAILVYTKQENIGDHSISYPRTQHRQISLNVEVYVKAKNNIDKDLDSLCLEVEKILSADLKLGGLVKDIVLSSTDIQFSDEGEKPIAVAVLGYSILYSVKENNPDTIH